jgi:hypothetical protein
MPPFSSALFMALTLGCCAPAWAWDGWDGEPALRLPGAPGVQAWTGTPSLRLSGWAHDLSLRLSTLQRPALTLSSRPPAVGRRFHMERSRSALALHWRPWATGAWAFGASLGLHRSLPGSASPGFAVMPVASYEQPHYRLNVGLMPSQGERSAAVVLGLMLPLR